MQKSFTVKLWKLMKICAAQIMIALTLCGIAVAHSNFAQVLDRQITINLTETPFEEALKQIATAAEVKFAYSISQLRNEAPVTIRAERRMLRDILGDVLGSRNIQYKVHEREKTITLKKNIENGIKGQSHIEITGDDSRKNVLHITGTVKDANTLQPMAGVNVIVKGTTRGTTSDADGNFTIEADDGEVLVFSFIGYAPMEIRLSGQTQIEVQLHEDITSLKEVVVNAGYYSTTKELQTGTIAKVESTEIEKQPVVNPLLALQGRMSGVVITPASGNAGSSMNIQIRGQNSLRREGNYPLYVIDGVPIDSRPTTSLNVVFNGLDPLNTINPNNIESIEILKDADATSIYGSRGANGVVLITTKRGTSGKTGVDIQAYSGAGHFTNRMDVMRTEEYLGMRMNALQNDGYLPLPVEWGIYFPDVALWDQQKHTDWQEVLLGGTARISDYQVSLTGGSELTSFRFGGGYHSESTVYPGDFGYRKVTGHLNLSHFTKNKKGSITASINYGRDLNNLFRGNAVSPALTLPPNAPLYTPSGELEWTGYDFFVIPNPMSQFQLDHTGRTSSLIANSVVSYTLANNLTVKANLGFSASGTNEVLNTPKKAMNPAALFNSSSDFNNIRTDSWIAEPQLIYERSVGDGELSLLTGATWQSSHADGHSLRATGYLSDDLLGNIRAASSVVSLSSNVVDYRYHAVFARAGYNWQGKYLVNLTGRRDASSRFGANRRFANFGAAGVGWIFTKENLFRSNVGVLSFGKVRASYGTSGSDQIGDYGYLSTLSVSDRYQGVSSLVTDALANPDFGWEINKKLEVALDLGFAKDRVLFSANWYRNQSSNQLVGYILPATTGFNSVQANLPATVRNTGLELEMQSLNVKRSQFKWSTSLNITLPANKLVSFPYLGNSSYADAYVVGKPITIIKAYEFRDVDPQTGDYRFTDANADGIYNNLDRNLVFNIGRRAFGGLNNAITYKGLKLDFLLEFVSQTGRDYMSIFLEPPGGMSNQPRFVSDKNHWKSPGDNAEHNKYTTISNNYRLASASNLNVTDASFVRLKTASLAYSLPEKLSQSIKAEEVTIFLTAQNLFMWSQYSGLNPEVPGGSNLPQLRIITGGIKLNF